jgi:hypothetical protein
MMQGMQLKGSSGSIIPSTKCQKRMLKSGQKKYHPRAFTGFSSSQESSNTTTYSSDIA